MNLLLSSERAYVDLKDWLDFGEPEQLCFREWIPEMTQDWEFRAYVSNNKVTSISQYEHYCHYPSLFPMKEKMQAMILEQFARTHEFVGCESYAVDFAYLPSLDKMILLELGPLLPCTGPHLFSWSVDAKQLHSGTEIEFRLASKEKALRHDDIAELIHYNWVDRWEELTKTPTWDKVYDQIVRDMKSRDFNAAVRSSVQVSIVAFLSTYFLISGVNPFYLSAGVLCITLGVTYNLPRIEYLWDDVIVPEYVQKKTYLFVYGTLKENYHWHSKFMSRTDLIGPATTRFKYPLVVGECGVAYMLLDQMGQGQQIIGELYELHPYELRGMDEYEGCNKTYYDRIKIEVNCGGNTYEKVNVYGIVQSDESRLELIPNAIEEWTYDMQQQGYQAIKHILVKQEKYLDGTRRYNNLTNEDYHETIHDN